MGRHREGCTPLREESGKLLKRRIGLSWLLPLCWLGFRLGGFSATCPCSSVVLGCSCCGGLLGGLQRSLLGEACGLGFGCFTPLLLALLRLLLALLLALLFALLLALLLALFTAGSLCSGTSRGCRAASLADDERVACDPAVTRSARRCQRHEGIERRQLFASGRHRGKRVRKSDVRLCATVYGAWCVARLL